MSTTSPDSINNCSDCKSCIMRRNWTNSVKRLRLILNHWSLLVKSASLSAHRVEKWQIPAPLQTNICEQSNRLENDTRTSRCETSSTSRRMCVCVCVCVCVFTWPGCASPSRPTAWWPCVGSACWSAPWSDSRLWCSGLCSWTRWVSSWTLSAPLHPEQAAPPGWHTQTQSISLLSAWWKDEDPSLFTVFVLCFPKGIFFSDIMFLTTSCWSTHLPPSAWKTTDSFPVLMQPLMFSSTPAFTILYISRRVRGSTACSWAEGERFGVWSSRSTPHFICAVWVLFVRTYSGGVLLLLVQSGAASLLAVAVLLQRVEHLIGQLQVHPQPVTDMDLWSKLEEERNRYVLRAKATKNPNARGRLTLSMRAVFLRPQVSSSCLVVMFLPFPVKPLLGVVWGLSDDQTHTDLHSDTL